MFGITLRGGGASYSVADGNIKLDMTHPTDEGAHQVWVRPGYTPSETIFVPRRRLTRPVGHSIEHDGVLLNVVLYTVSGSSALVVLDAQTVEEIGRAEMGRVFPIGFHSDKTRIV